MPSLACSFNIYNDNLALPGMLESASQWADSFYCIHASPGGKLSTDGTLETLQSWGITPVMADVMEGFGVIRSRLIHECGADWAFILDADERVLSTRNIMSVEGSDKYPENPNPQLTITKGMPFDQMKLLKSLIDSVDGFDAIVLPRYHFMDAGFTRPAQSWHQHRDLQCRLVRNVPYVGYKPERKIHEHIIDTRSGNEPAMYRPKEDAREVAIFHLHNVFKPMTPAKNTEDLATYQALDKSLTEGMWLEKAKMI